MARVVLRRSRCWWQPPFGHVDEVIDYVDSLSGRWAARMRCARCGRETGLRIGASRFAAVYPNMPLLAMLIRHGTERRVPTRPGGAAPASQQKATIDVETPGGKRISVRRVRARLPFGRRRDLYLAALADAEGPPTVAADLRRALVRAGGVPSDERWLDQAVRQLEAELPAGS